MKRDVYHDPLPEMDKPSDEARQRRRAAYRYKPRSEMTPEELAEVRKRGCERQKAYLIRKRIAAGLPPVGRPGRPTKGSKKTA